MRVELDAKFSTAYSAKTFRVVGYTIFLLDSSATFLLFYISNYIKTCYLILVDIICNQAKLIPKNKLRQSLEPKN